MQKSFAVAALVAAITLATTLAADLSADGTGALWVARSRGLTAVATDSGTPKLELELGANPRAIAVDPDLGSVWTYGGGRLRGFGPDGVSWLNAAAPQPKDELLVDIAVDARAGRLWVASGKELFRYSIAGGYLGVFRTQNPIDALTLDAGRSELWLAAKQRLTAVAASGQTLRTVELGNGTQVVDIAFDASRDALWVSTQTSLRRYASDGSLAFSLSLGLHSAVRELQPDGHGGLWAHDGDRLVHLDAQGAITRTLEPFDGHGYGDHDDGDDDDGHHKPSAGRAGKSGNDDEDEPRIVDAAADAATGSVWVASRERVREYGLDGVRKHDLPLASGHGRSIYRIAIASDKVAPQVQILSPSADGYLGAAQPTVALAFLDTGIGVDLTSVEATLDGAAIALTCAGDDEYADCGFAQPLSEGAHTLRLTLADANGNRSAPAEVAFTVDTIAPVVTITTPAAGAVTNSAAQPVTGSVSEVATVTLGAQPLVQQADHSFSASVTLIPGPNSITVTARDRAGNTGTATVQVTLDGTAPVITLSSPSDGLVTNQASVDVAGSVNKAATVTVDGTAAAVAADLSFSGSVALDEGSKLIVVGARDAAGNQAQVTVSVTRDTAQPAPVDPSQISVSLPVNGFVTIAGGAGTAEAGATVRIVNGRTGEVVTATVAADGSFSAALAAERRDPLIITVIDAAGNASTEQGNTVPGDLTPPTLTITSPHADAFLNAAQPAFTFAFSDDDSGVDPSSLLATLDGAPLALDCGTPTASGATCTPTTPLTEVAHTLSVTLADLAGNRNAPVTLAFTVDLTAPVVTLTAPTSTLTNLPSQAFTGTMDELATLTLNDAPLAQAADLSFTSPLTLVEGANLYRLVATDRAGNATIVERSVTLDTVAPAITLTQPDDGQYTNQPQVDVSGHLSKQAAVTLNGEALALTPELDFATGVALLEGGNTLLLSATDAAGNTTQVTRSVVRDTAPPIAIAPGDFVLGLSVNGVVNASGAAGTVEAGATVRLRNLRTGQVVTVTAGADGAFSAAIGALPNDLIEVVTFDQAGNASEPTQGQVSPLPPDPSLVAPPLAKDHANLMHEAVAFLYSGANPIQTGVAPGTIDPVHIAVLRGRVMDREGNLLPGVTVTVKGRPELGQTLSRSDGMFDLAVNGGGTLTLNYRKDGRLPVQRQVAAPVQDYAWLPDVAMIALDPTVSLVDLSSPAPFQVARGSVVTDGDGTRQSTILFPRGTTATMYLPDGSTQPLSTLHVRATEYTVGANGDDAMPGALPPSSAYTYAVELSVDEVLAAGGKKVAGRDVVFNQPVINYLENFLDFPVGTIVPSGYYDADASVWRSNKDGLVVKVVSIAGGLAVLDTDGNSTPDDALRYAELGITDDERAQLAQLYAVGQSMWRVQMTSFSTKDHNMTPRLLDFLAPHIGLDPVPPISSAKPDCQTGSVITCQTQKLGESVAITATPFSATYSSDRVPGRRAAYRYEIELADENGAPGITAIHLEVFVGGRKYTQVFAPDNSTGHPPFYKLKHTFEWDGLDAYGRPVTGPQPLLARVGYEHRVAYFSVSSSSGGAALEGCRWEPCPKTGGSFGVPGNTGSAIMLTKGEAKSIVWRDARSVIGTLDTRSAGLGGWTLDAHHAYAPGAQRLYTGDGQSRDFSALTGVFEVFAGAGCVGGSAFPTGDAKTVCFSPKDIAIAPGGRIYFTIVGSATTNRMVGAIERDGTVHAFATLPENVTRIELGKDGALYARVSNAGRGHSLYRVSDDGTVTRVVGNGIEGVPTVGALATATSFNIVAYEVGPDGVLYIAHTNQSGGTPVTVYRIVPGGTVTKLFVGSTSSVGLTDLALTPDGSLLYGGGSNTAVDAFHGDGTTARFAGKGGSNFGAGDGGPATEAVFLSPQRFRATQTGDVYIFEGGRVRKVDGTGTITKVAGGGDTTAPNAIGGPAIYMTVDSGMTVDADPATGVVYFASPASRRIYAVRQNLPSFDGSTQTIASTDGSELYEFDAVGRHLRTLDTMTGAERYAFGYDGMGRLETITDVDGDITHIEHDAAGNPTAIVSADGQRTVLSVNGEGFLNAFTSPADETHGISYFPGGLLESFTSPKGNASHMAYTDDGLLLSDTDAGEGGWTLGFMQDETGSLSSMTTAEGRSHSYRTKFDGTKTETRTNTAPDGTVSSTVIGSNWQQSSTSADGTVMTTTLRNDPRFKMQATIPALTTVATPSGLTSTVTQSRVAVLSDPTNPLSLTSQTDTVSVNGKQTRTVYVAGTRTYTTTSAANRISTVQVDAKGKPMLSQVTGLAGASYGYDARGRMATLTVGTGSDARSTTFNYYDTGPSAGYLKTVTDAENRTVEYRYDLAGRVIEQVLPDARVIGYRYDANGNLLGLTPPGKPEHAFSYTVQDLEGEYTPPDVVPGSDATVYGYDKDKLLRSITRPDGAVLGFEYGADGKLDTLTTPNGVYGYAYKPVTGQLETLVAPGGEALGYSYDGFLLKQVQATGTIAGTVGFGYDTDFRVTSLSVNGSPISFGYDNDSLLTSAGSLTIARSAQNGLISGTTLGSTITTTSYNAFGESQVDEAKYSGTSLFREEVTSRDKLGRITAKTETVQGVAHSYAYGYDLAGRLETVDRDGARYSTYAYDPNGNRLSATLSGSGRSSGTGVYDAQDRMLSYGAASFVYTANGELDTKTDGSGLSDVDYDVLGNLRHVELPNGTTLDYLIDGQNRRIGKRINGVLVQGFLYQDQLEPVAELDGSGAIVSRFVYASKAHVPDYMIKGGVTYRIVSDHLGSVRLVVNTSDGSIAQHMDYDEFGVVTQDTNPGFQPFGYAGGIYDRHTGLTRFGARDYDPVSGRWTAKDSIRFRGGDTSLYTYVRSNPVNSLDVTGKNTVAAGASVGGFFGGPIGAIAGGIVGAAIGAWLGWDVIGPMLNENSSGENTPENAPPIPDNPGESPGSDWEWKGTGTPDTGKGNWVNPKTGQKLHPDLAHGPPKGPHWGLTNPDGKKWDYFPDKGEWKTCP